MAPDRSTGVQQGRYVVWRCPIPECGNLSAYGKAHDLEMQRRAEPLCHGSDARPYPGSHEPTPMVPVEVVEVVPLEPRIGDVCRCDHDQSTHMATAPFSCMRCGCQQFRPPEPREGDQEGVDSLPSGRGFTDEQRRAVDALVAFADAVLPRYDMAPEWAHTLESALAVLRGPEPKVEAAHRLRNRADSDAIEQSHGDASNEHSVASVLRLTASRLRDPEYHWYEDAAVTLERLAERLEKGRDDG